MFFNYFLFHNQAKFEKKDFLGYYLFLIKQKGFILRLVVGITGASGSNLALKFLKLLPENIDAFVVISSSAKVAFKHENNSTFEELQNKKNIKFFSNKDISAPIASGSFKTDKMIILPCSMNTLAKCAHGLADNLITRAFSVAIKEKEKLYLYQERCLFL